MLILWILLSFCIVPIEKDCIFAGGMDSDVCVSMVDALGAPDMENIVNDFHDHPIEGFTMDEVTTMLSDFHDHAIQGFAASPPQQLLHSLLLLTGCIWVNCEL